MRGRVCGRIGPLVHWYLCVVAVRAGGRARTCPVRSGRARESRGPVRFTRARGASPDSAAAAQGHFCHTLSVRRWPGASPQRGGRLVVRPAAPASRKHPVVIGAGCAARERRWKGPMPSFSALSAWHSRRRGRLPHFLPRAAAPRGRALLRRPALTPTAPLRLRCLVWVDSTSCSSDDAEDP